MRLTCLIGALGSAALLASCGSGDEAGREAANAVAANAIAPMDQGLIEANVAEANMTANEASAPAEPSVRSVKSTPAPAPRPERRAAPPPPRKASPPKAPADPPPPKEDPHAGHDMGNHSQP